MSHSNDNDKARRELEVFHEFAHRCGLSIVSGSIENREPPQPDIYCEIEGEGPMAFELAEFADERIAKESAHVRKHPEDSGKKYIRAGEVMPILAHKFARNYDSSCPIDLICYIAGRIFLPPNVLVPQMCTYIKEHPDTGPFRGVWFLSVQEGEECCKRVV